MHPEQETTCACSRCTWDPSKNLGLVALRQAWPNRTDDDREAADIADVDPDGMVVWRKSTLNEQLAYAVAKWIWSEATGEVE